MKRHSTSPPCGNMVDGLPHDCYRKTIAKPTGLGPTENDELMENFIEITMFCSMTSTNVPGFIVQNILKI